MTTFNSDIYAKQIAPTAKNMASAIVVAGGIAYYEAKVTIVSGTASGDKFNIVEVPANMRLIEDLSTVAVDGLGTGCTLDVGDTDDTVAADPDRYADGLDVAAAGIDKFSANASAQRLTPYTTRKTCIIQATLAVTSAGAVTVGKVAVFKLAFACL